MKWLILPCLCLLALTLTGCAELDRISAEAEARRIQGEIAAQQHQLMMDRMQCEQFGLAYGTQPFADCMAYANTVRIEQSYRDSERQARQQELDRVLAIQQGEREERERREQERWEKQEWERGRRDRERDGRHSERGSEPSSRGHHHADNAPPPPPPPPPPPSPPPFLQPSDMLGKHSDDPFKQSSREIDERFKQSSHFLGAQQERKKKQEQGN